MLDKTTMDMVSSFRKTNWLLEDVQAEKKPEKNTSNIKELKAGDEPYDELVRTLKEYLQSSIILQIFSFKYSKVSNKTSIEVTGTIQNTLDFRYNFGINDGVYISTSNSDVLLSQQIVQGIEKLYTYYNTQFSEICALIIQE